VINKTLPFSFIILILLAPLCRCSNSPKELDNKDSTVTALNILASQYIYDDPDSALILADAALEIAQKNKTVPKRLEARSLNTIGRSYEVKGEYIKALDTLTKAKKIYEDINDILGENIIYTNISIVYKDENNFNRALGYAYRVMVIDELLHIQKSLLIDYENIGYLYYKNGNYHSAKLYTKKAINLAKAFLRNAHSEKIENTKSELMSNLGSIYLSGSNSTNHYLDTALLNYREALKNSQLDKESYCEAMLGIAKCLSQKGEKDHAKDTARKSFLTANVTHNNLAILEASQFLAQLYADSLEQRDTTKSCYYRAVALEKTNFLYIKENESFIALNDSEENHEKWLQEEIAKTQKRKDDSSQFLSITAFLTFIFVFLIIIDDKLPSIKSLITRIKGIKWHNVRSILQEKSELNIPKLKRINIKQFIAQKKSRVIFLKRAWLIFIFIAYEFLMFFIEPHIANISEERGKIYAYIFQCGIGLILYVIHKKFEELIDRRFHADTVKV